MANSITGKTDITGALTVAPTLPKSVLLVGKVTGTPTKVVSPNTLFSILGTSDAGDVYGTASILVKAVKVLVQSGVDNIYGIVVNNGTTVKEDYANALEASLGEKSIKCIVLDNLTDDVITELKTHLAMAESEDLFRYSAVAIASDDRDEIISYAKTKLNDSRIFIVGHSFVNSDNTSVNPILVATSLVGAIMTETADPALPMNNVSLVGIGSVSVAVLQSERNLLASNGVVAVYNDGTPIIHRLVTSDTTNVVWQEGTTRFIADYILENVENTLRASYQRTKNVVRILDAIKTTTKGLLENYEGLEIIENFDPATLSVVKDPADSYGALVNYEFDVVTPLYTISINQHMKL